MSNEKLARQWAERAKNSKHFEDYADDAAAAVELVLATTPPPTMADIVWDDEEHTLTGATLNYGHGPTDVIMLDKDGNSFINYITTDEHAHGDASPSALTPNGKRYALYEVAPTVSSNENVGADQPEHPATLETVEDYVNAPHGTIVAEPGYYAWTKDNDGDWQQGNGWRTSDEMAGTKREELRKGWKR